MSKTITHNNLKKIIANQKRFKDEAPVTSRATFKLGDVASFLGEIATIVKNNLETKGEKPNESINHDICIVFVREQYLKGKDVTDLDYSYSNPAHQEIWENGPEKDKEKFTKLIPIIVGSECKLDINNYKTKSFKFLRDGDGNIPFVRPGGEGSGLIPPPPTGDDDEK